MTVEGQAVNQGMWAVLRSLFLYMILSLTFVALFAEFGGDRLYSDFQRFDKEVWQGMKLIRSPELTRLALTVTSLGTVFMQIVLLLAIVPMLILVWKRRMEAQVWMLQFTGAWLLNIGMKQIFRRSRPGWEHLASAGGFSFPSGHAMVSVSFYGMLAYFVWLALRESNPLIARMSLSGFALLILAIGLSRIYLGVHYATDVAAGFAAGGIWLAGCVKAVRGFRTVH